MENSIIIDCFPESALRYRDRYAIVVIDVIRATTTLTTALSQGRSVYPVQTTDEAFVLSSALQDPLLVGELGGNVPYGFHMTNSPVQVTALKVVPAGSFSDIRRPIVLLSSSGTQLLLNAVGSEAVYIACFRNFSAVAKYISGRHQRIAILGAGTRGRFRREDQMGCAWVAEKLVNAGYKAETTETKEIISHWIGKSPEEIRGGESAEYLKRTGQIHDLEFILHHIDDIDVVPMFENGKLIQVSGKSPRQL